MTDAPAAFRRVPRTGVIYVTAQARKAGFADLTTVPMAGLTDNGVHLTAYGYWRMSVALAQELNRGLPFGRMTFHHQKQMLF